jgi:hypothetical protein
MTPAWAGGQHLKGDVHGPPPELELAEVDVELVVFLGILEAAEVADIAADAHVVVEEPITPAPRLMPTLLFDTSKTSSALSLDARATVKETSCVRRECNVHAPSDPRVG